MGPVSAECKWQSLSSFDSSAPSPVYENSTKTTVKMLPARLSARCASDTPSPSTTAPSTPNTRVHGVVLGPRLVTSIISPQLQRRSYGLVFRAILFRRPFGLVRSGSPCPATQCSPVRLLPIDRTCACAQGAHMRLSLSFAKGPPKLFLKRFGHFARQPFLLPVTGFLVMAAASRVAGRCQGKTPSYYPTNCSATRSFLPFRGPPLGWREVLQRSISP